MSESRSLKQKACAGCGGYGFNMHDNGGDGSPQHPLHDAPITCEICGGSGTIPERLATQQDTTP